MIKERGRKNIWKRGKRGRFREEVKVRFLSAFPKLNGLCYGRTGNANLLLIAFNSDIFDSNSNCIVCRSLFRMGLYILWGGKVTPFVWNRGFSSQDNGCLTPWKLQSIWQKRNLHRNIFKQVPHLFLEIEILHYEMAMFNSREVATKLTGLKSLWTYF